MSAEVAESAADDAVADETALSVEEIADLFDITPRRVRQLREDGYMIARGRGRIDAPHAVNARIGLMILSPARAARLNKYTIAAVGWLTGQKGVGVGRGDLDAFYKMAARWGLSRDQAQAHLIEAAVTLGTAAPEFDFGPRRR